MSASDQKVETVASLPIKPAGFGYRHIQYFLLFAGLVVAYGIRTVLNVAVLDMIKPDSGGNSYPTYPEWADKKNIMLSSFFWGYICLQIGAGQIAKNYGPKLFLGAAMCITSLFTILVPVLGGSMGYGGVLLSRIIQGLSQGFLMPSVHNLLARWTPISEMAKWGTTVYAGQALGNVIAMPVTGFICETKYGWPLAFYVYGGAGIIWCVLWISFGSNGPRKHKNISDQEKKFIESSRFNEEDSSKSSTPWKSIFTSLPLYAILVAHCGQVWGFWTILTEIPTYMKNILGQNIASNSLLSALPYLALWLLSMVFSPIADIIIENKMVSLIASRKIFNTIGFAAPAVSLIILCFFNDVTISTVLLVIAVGINAGNFSGFNINHIDISPTHSGTLMALTNSCAASCAILAPLSVDLFAKISGYDETDKRLWNIVFCTASAIYAGTGLFFIIFASGDIQPWDSSESKKEEDKTEEEKSKLKILRKISVMSAS